jgi:hypothetical protein
MKIFLEKAIFELSDDAVSEPFKTEIMHRLHILESKTDVRKDVEIGGHQEHPLGEHPTLWMNLQYLTNRVHAVARMNGDPGRTDSIAYNARLIYPSYGFLLRRFLVRIVFILKKHQRASYPNVGWTEVAYLHIPTHLLKRFRIFMARIKLFTLKKPRDNRERDT